VQRNAPSVKARENGAEDEARHGPPEILDPLHAGR